MEISNKLELVAADLCGDPGLAERHIEALQSIDLICQTQQSLADIFSADRPDIAVDALGIDMLKARFVAEST